MIYHRGERCLLWKPDMLCKAVKIILINWFLMDFFCTCIANPCKVNTIFWWLQRKHCAVWILPPFNPDSQDPSSLSTSPLSVLSTIHVTCGILGDFTFTWNSSMYLRFFLFFGGGRAEWMLVWLHPHWPYYKGWEPWRVREMEGAEKRNGSAAFFSAGFSVRQTQEQWCD